MARRGPIQFIKELKRRGGWVRDLRAFADMSLRLGAKSYKAREAVLIKNPAMLRLETLGIFGRSVFLFSSDRRRLRMFYPRERKYYTAEATAEKLRELFGIHLPVTVLTTLASGAVPLPLRFLSPTVSTLDAKKIDILTFRIIYGGWQQVWFDARFGDPLRTYLYDEIGRIMVMAQFGEFEVMDEVRFPHFIELILPYDAARLILSYEDVELNVGLNNTVFKFPAPPGVEVIDLDETS